MTDLEPPTDDDYANFESTVTFIVRATKREVIDDWENDDRYEKYGDDRTLFETEGHLRFEERLGNNMVNLDHYFSPLADQMYDYPNEVDAGDGAVIHCGYNDVEAIFDLYEPEVMKSATKRAAEDHKHVVQTLADWTYQAAMADHVDHAAHSLLRCLRNALEVESIEGDGAPEWAFTYGGTLEDWKRRSHGHVDPIDTVEEVEIAVENESIQAVFDAREGGDADV